MIKMNKTHAEEVYNYLKFLKNKDVTFDKEEFGEGVQLKLKFYLIPRLIMQRIYLDISNALNDPGMIGQKIHIECLRKGRPWTMTYTYRCMICSGITTSIIDLDKVRSLDEPCCVCLLKQKAYESK